MEKLLIGSEEWCNLPDLGIPAIKARVDSGAKTSSIHAVNISTFKRDGHKWVRYEVFPLQDNRRVSIHCESKIVNTRYIKSSTGVSEKRYIIKTPLTLGNDTWDIEITLANRDSMGYRMLLGREAMIGRTVIDPSQEQCVVNYSFEQLNKFYKIDNKKKSGFKIGLLASNPELYSNKRIIEAGEERGHEMFFLNAQQCYVKMDANTPEIHYRGGKVINNLDAIIPRIKPSMTFYGCALIRQFDSVGTYALNKAEAISQSRDKLYSSQLFSKNGIQIPTTGFANSPIETKDLIEMVNGAPLIIKLLESTQGKGVVLAETNKAAESVINAFKSLKTNILVQEFIKEAGGKDLRCFVIDGKVVASIERIAVKGEFRANIHQGGSANIIKITSEEKKLAIKAAKVLDLDVAGVDLIRSNKGPLLLEVNSSPGLEGIEKATGKDIASMMIYAVEKRIAHKKE
ncbi:30S ribosomal protein S6--L-glutamate ligase [Lutibacter sp. B1]|uniref:30S ribosomal protein S6--L-glutamate ligase n=1 Tax=Lutibacter sp. B1 TaxID=2725996 RepID=UPI001B3A563F|nr:30S ribosomal protein S6--L-glutamate ligase [Lutibacter sp. B1]